MKLNSGPSSHEKWKAKGRWHNYFAWTPVRVGSRESRWLETVERRRKGSSPSGLAVYEYRTEELQAVDSEKPKKASKKPKNKLFRLVLVAAVIGVAVSMYNFWKRHKQ